MTVLIRGKKYREMQEQCAREQELAKQKGKIQRRSRRYYRKNQEEIREKARERMARKREQMSTEEKEAAKARQQQYSRTSYQRRRNDILHKETKKRHKAFIEKNGREEFDQAYPSREVRPRYLLGLKDDPSNIEQYQKEYKRWKNQVSINRYHEDYMHRYG
ncbi:hypothetical protein V5O48_013752 [Marasmius crinis-equi]|uniref:Uncharacterized protein n=1 Tax=Marasmius crinis-equi TaxID=585013 RepID=A0ABR3EZ77_9AGAR